VTVLEILIDDFELAFKLDFLIEPTL
jgi:hypothetical protein